MEMKLNFQDVFAGEPCFVEVFKDPKTGKDVEIPSFVAGQHYAGNFGKQWARFRDIQLDSVNGSTISQSYLETLIGNPVQSIAGKTVMEVGAGAGRFTEHFVRFAKQVVAVDLSEAIFVNSGLGAENLIAAQANLLEMPPLKMQFDLVYCRGVLQHTPDPVQSIAQLHRWVKPGGMVAFDIYSPGTLGKFGAKYLLRPVIQRLFNYESFLNFLESYAAPLLRLRWQIKPFFPGKSKNLLDFVLPIYDYRDILQLTDEQLIEWGKLDTLDAFFAHFDNPMSCEQVLRALRDMGVKVLAADRDLNFFRSSVSKETPAPLKKPHMHLAERPVV
jgi:2-polyprenyl-3-methyl-5-hydroxy-6-metoxy-1,4-benzoquinol methylase